MVFQTTVEIESLSRDCLCWLLLCEGRSVKTMRHHVAHVT